MPQFNNKCPDCKSDLIVNGNPSDVIQDYPFEPAKHLTIPLICSEGCGYECYHSLTFVCRVDEKNPLALTSDYDALLERVKSLKTSTTNHVTNVPTIKSGKGLYIPNNVLADKYA